MCIAAEHFMSQFFIVPYSLLPGHNARTVRHISAEHCAQLCVHDHLIVCRSFDYHVSHPPSSHIALMGSQLSLAAKCSVTRTKVNEKLKMKLK